MVDKQLTIAVLGERVGTAITVTKWVAGVCGPLVLGFAAFFLLRISEHGERLAGMQKELEGIRAEQAKTIPALIAEALKNPSPDNLKIVTRVLESSRKVDKKSNPDLLASVGQGLYRVATSPDPPANIWSASAQLVSYRSEQSNVLVGAQAPDCFSRSPSGAEVTLLPDRKTFQITGKRFYRDCVLHLDGTDNPVYYHPNGSVFENCIVKYQGGPPKLYGPIEFKNCVFWLSAADEIPTLGRQLVLALLKAPTLVTVNLTVPFS